MNDNAAFLQEIDVGALLRAFQLEEILPPASPPSHKHPYPTPVLSLALSFPLSSKHLHFEAYVPV